MTDILKTGQTQQQFKEVFARILSDFKKQEKFVSVSVKPVYTMFDEFGIPKDISRRIFRFLEEELIIEVEGNRGGMRYKASEILLTMESEDFDDLTKKILVEIPQISRIKSFNKPVSKRLAIAASTVRHIFTPGESCYVLCEENIEKAVIVQCQFMSFQRMLEEMTEKGTVSAAKSYNDTLEYYVLTENSSKLFKTRNIYTSIEGLLSSLKARYTSSH